MISIFGSVGYKKNDNLTIMSMLTSLTSSSSSTTSSNTQPKSTNKPTEKKEYKKGDLVYFGHYEQDNNEANDQERIVWIVLDEKDGNLFLLSRKALERHRFHTRSNGETWKGSELREWLNSTFLYTAFSSSEVKAILTTDVEDNEMHTNQKFNSAKRFSGTTKDKVFLLSYKEAKELLTTSQRVCEPTNYLRAKGIALESYNGRSACWYWLRTSAYKNNAIVISGKGAYESCYIHHDYGSVRPALWVEASAVEKTP